MFCYRCATLIAHPKRAVCITQQQAQMWLFVRVNFARRIANWHFSSQEYSICAREFATHADRSIWRTLCASKGRVEQNSQIRIHGSMLAEQWGVVIERGAIHRM